MRPLCRLAAVTLAAVLALLAFAGTSIAAADSTQLTPSDAARATAGLPLIFEANQGQATRLYNFVAHGKGYGIFLSDHDAVLRVHSGHATDVLTMHPIAARPVIPVGTTSSTSRVNYIFADRSTIPNTRTFERVRYRDLYPGIDLAYYGHAGQLEYDFIVAPRTDPRQIKLEINGAQRLTIASNGELVLSTSAGHEIRWHKPVAYQTIAGMKRPVEAAYKLEGNSIAFELGAYDHTRRLVIDPVLSWSTYLGGSQQSPNNAEVTSDGIRAIAVDAAHNVYVAGSTTSADFPTTPGTLDPQSTIPNDCGADGFCEGVPFVSKLSPGGARLIYSTFLPPGSVAKIAVDANGRAYLATTGLDTVCHCETGLTILNATGSAIDFQAGLRPSQFLTINVRSLAVGTSGVAYLAGDTDDPNLPTTPNAFQPNFTNPSPFPHDHGWFAKIDPRLPPASAFQYLSYLAGTTGDDFINGIATIAGNAYLTGSTTSSDFPVTPGAAQPTLQGTLGSFITKINTNASGQAGLVYSTHLNGTEALEIATDSVGDAIVGGNVFDPSHFTTTPGVFQPTTRSGEDVTVSVLNATGTKFLMSTYLGGSLGAFLRGLALDTSRRIHVAGFTGSTDFPVTPGALRRTKCTDCSPDAFYSKLSFDGTKLLYSTYLGGPGLGPNPSNDVGGITTDDVNSAYIAGFTLSSSFPVTGGAFQKTRHGANDAFITKFTRTDLCPLNQANPSVTLCLPKPPTASTNMHVLAGSTDSQPITLMQIYVDGVKKYDVFNAGSFEVFLPVTPGEHRVALQAKDALGRLIKTTTIVNVQ